MRAIKWIAMVGLLAAAPATAFAHGWREPEPVRRVEVRPAAAVYVTPRVEVVRHHRWWGHRQHHAVWVPGHWAWAGHHRVYQRGYWSRGW
jgi:hypothetical protein